MCTRRALPLGNQAGVGLIEVLIAVVVLSIGMLGLANLQMFSLRNNQSALERGMAVVQSHSIIDAMRADRGNAVNGAFDLALDAESPTGTTFPQSALATWRTNLTAVLGTDAIGSVDCDGALCTIIVQWNDERAGGSSAARVVTQVQL